MFFFIFLLFSFSFLFLFWKWARYDIEQELKAFDDRKAGVRGLVEAGIAKVPRLFLMAKEFTIPVSKEFTIPVIDLKGINVEKDGTRRKEIINQVQNAAENWGFFQVVNHGIPAELLHEMLERVRMFNEQPKEERAKFYTRDGTKKVVYNTFFDMYRKALYWRDNITFMTAPDFPDRSEMPIQFRDILMEYSKHATNLGKALLELLSEGLGLEKEHLNDEGCLKVLYIGCHYYPPCPQPELTLATPKHSDNNCLTIVQQDQIGGSLQVLHQDQWIDVPPIHGALVVNFGYILQGITNGKFKSAAHRVLANRVGPRMSVRSFFTKPSNACVNI